MSVKHKGGDDFATLKGGNGVSKHKAGDDITACKGVNGVTEHKGAIASLNAKEAMA